MIGGLQQNIAKLLNRAIQWGHTTHKYMCKVLGKLKVVPIIWEDSFYQKETATTEKLVTFFNLLDDLAIFERRKDARKGQIYFALSCFRFNSRIISNLLNNYSKPLYLDVILKFKKEISVLLYRHIDLIMADKNLYERRTLELFSDLELSEYSRPSARKRLLDPVLKELEGIELTTGILDYVKLEKTTDGKDWKVVFKKSKKRLKIEHKKGQEKTNNSADQAIDFFNQKFLDKKGTFTGDTAEKLIAEYSLDKVMLHIARISNDGSVNNPAGLLRTSLEKSWEFQPSEEEMIEKEKQAREDREKKQREEHRREKEMYLKEKEEEEKLNKIFLSLSPEEQESLKEEARQRITAEHLENGQGKTNKFLLIDVMVMIKVRELLRKKNQGVYAATLEKR